MFKSICSNIITTIVASIVLIVGSIGCCARQHLDFNFPSLSNDCDSLGNIEKYIETLDKVVESNGVIFDELKKITEELAKKPKEINVYPTSLTLKLLNNISKEDCFTVTTGGPISSVASSNGMVAATTFDRKNRKYDDIGKEQICICGEREGDVVITIVNKAGLTKDVKVSVVDISLKVIEVGGERVETAKPIEIEKWEKKKIIIKSNFEPKVDPDNVVDRNLEKLVFNKIIESEDMWESIIKFKGSGNGTQAFPINFYNSVGGKDEITVKVK